MITQEDLGSLDGAEVDDDTGERIGTVGQVYLDPHSGEPLWVTVRTGSFGFQESFVPLAGARLADGRLAVAVGQARVREAPLLDPEAPLDADQAERLSAHYGLTVSHADDAMTRSEERLVAGTRREPTEKVRLRKYLVTEERQITVPVTREEVRLERVPVDAPDDPGTGVAATLHAEEPEVTMKSVPVERVRLDKEIVADEEMVTGEVRKEKIVYEGPEA